jgi:phage terminase large subunit-like protein
MDFQTGLSSVFRNVIMFSDVMSGIQLREYQVGPAAAIVESVKRKAGRSFVIIFPRQSGKNELQAQIEAYLLFMLQEQDAEIVKASPT